MTTSRFPWPWRPESRSVLLVGILWIALVSGWAFLARDVLPLRRAVPPWSADVVREAPPLARLDSGWYRTIVLGGYGPPPPAGSESEHAFFPLYPSAARLLHLATGLPPFPSLLAVSWGALLLALPLYVEETRRRFGTGSDLRALPFLLLYPTAFFLAAAYTESLFLLLALLSFRSVRRGSAAWGVAFGFLAGLTRAPAAALGPALAVAWLFEEETVPDRRLGRLPAALALGAAPLAGVLAWTQGVGLALGEPGLFYRVMSAWRHGLGDPGKGIFSFAREFADLFSSGYVRSHPGALVPYALLLLLLSLAAWSLRSGRPSDAAWMASLVALPILTGTAAGVPRYTLTVFPVTLTLALLLGGSAFLRGAWLAGSAALLLYYSARFACWHFVS